MPTATIDHLEVSFVTRGSGPALLMLAPGGFDATMEKWATAGVWKGMQPLDSFSRDFTVIAYDRRESGESGGPVDLASPGRSRRALRSVFPDGVFGSSLRISIRRGYSCRLNRALTNS